MTININSSASAQTRINGFSWNEFVAPIDADYGRFTQMNKI